MPFLIYAWSYTNFVDTIFIHGTYQHSHEASPDRRLLVVKLAGNCTECTNLGVNLRNYSPTFNRQVWLTFLEL